jgi:Cellulose binding domain
MTDPVWSPVVSGRHRSGEPGEEEPSDRAPRIVAAGLLLVVLVVIGVVVVRMATGTAAAPAPPRPAPAAVPSTPVAVPVATASSPVATGKPARPGSTPASGGSVQARYQVTSVWDTGLVARVRVTNDGGTARSWVVVLTLPPGVEPTSVWNAQLSRTGQAFRFSADALRAGGSVTFGFQASRTGAYEPVSCTVNGEPC